MKTSLETRTSDRAEQTERRSRSRPTPDPTSGKALTVTLFAGRSLQVNSNLYGDVTVISL